MFMNPSSGRTYLKYVQATFFTAAILYFGKALFIPVLFGLLIAMVMHPIAKWLEKHRWTRSLSITACLLIVAILFAAIVALFAWQLAVFSEDAPAILNKLEEALVPVRNWLNENFGIRIDFKNSTTETFASTLGLLLKFGIQTLLSTLFNLFLIPVYTALFMYHRKVLVQYLKAITPQNYQHQLDTILKETILTYFNYIKGLILVYIIVGILNSIGLLALGIKHAILFGMLCAIMTIIPYFGIIVSAMLPISVAWLETGNIWYPIGVICIFTFVQYLEANVIFPKVVGTQLHMNTLAILIVIIAGGIIWGASGMVLFIPIVSILKIVSEHIEEWKPLNLLLSRS